MFKKLKSNKGETMVEVLVALLVFGLVTLVFVNMFTNVTRINKLARDIYSEDAQASAYFDGNNYANYEILTTYSDGNVERTAVVQPAAFTADSTITQSVTMDNIVFYTPTGTAVEHPFDNGAGTTTTREGFQIHAVLEETTGSLGMDSTLKRIIPKTS